MSRATCYLRAREWAQRSRRAIVLARSIDAYGVLIGPEWRQKRDQATQLAREALAACLQWREAGKLARQESAQ